MSIIYNGQKDERLMRQAIVDMADKLISEDENCV